MVIHCEKRAATSSAVLSEKNYAKESVAFPCAENFLRIVRLRMHSTNECKSKVAVNRKVWRRALGGLHPGFPLSRENAAVLLNGLKMLNKIEWFKPNAPPNIGCRQFTHSHETLIWFGRADLKGYTFNYAEMKAWADTEDFIKKADKQMRDVFVAEAEASPPDMITAPVVPKSEKTQGKYPTQKPRKLLNRLLTAMTNEGDLVLDPFTGSSTTGLEACAMNRRFIGIDDNSERTADGLTALELSEARYRAEFMSEFVQ